MSYNVKRMLQTAVCLFLSTVSFSAFSQVQGCIKYQRADYSWSHPYKVRGEVLSGSDLNSATNSHNYSASSYYFYVPFKKGGYVTLEIPIGSSLPLSDSTTKDQRGKRWSMKSGWGLCN